MDRRMDPRSDQTKLSLAESRYLHPGPRQCPCEQTRKFFLNLLHTGCGLELTLGKYETLSGLQPLNPEEAAHSEAAQLPTLEEDSHRQHKSCKHCLGQSQQRP